MQFFIILTMLITSVGCLHTKHRKVKKTYHTKQCPAELKTDIPKDEEPPVYITIDINNDQDVDVDNENVNNIRNDIELVMEMSNTEMETEISLFDEDYNQYNFTLVDRLCERKHKNKRNGRKCRLIQRRLLEELMN